MPKKHYYVVSGRYQFPSDMLRHDDALVVKTGMLPVLNEPGYLIYGRCTKDRWRSFLWTVFNVKSRLPAGDSERGPVVWQVEVSPGDWQVIHWNDCPKDERRV